MKRTFLIAAVALFGAVLVMPAGAALAADPLVTFLTPVPGSTVPPGKVVIIGHLSGEVANLRLMLDGIKVDKVSIDGRGFWATVDVPKGNHTVEVKAFSSLGQMTFIAGEGGKTFSYHYPVTEGKCSVCHIIGGYRDRAAKESACRQCHKPVDRGTYLHGPVSTGECYFCHNPHGSIHGHLARREMRKECASCHDQPSSQAHMNRKGNADCVKCHDPHGGDNKLFLKKS